MEFLIEVKDPLIKPYKSKILPDLYNIICSYLLISFNPIQSWNLCIINPDIYPHHKYQQDLQNYKIDVFEEVYTYIELEFRKLQNNNRYLSFDLSGDYTIKKMRYNTWILNLFSYVIVAFRKYYLEVPPITKIIEYDHYLVILEVEISLKSYKIYLHKKGLEILKQKIPFELLSYFWKLIYFIMYINCFNILPDEILEKY